MFGRRAQRDLNKEVVETLADLHGRLRRVEGLLAESYDLGQPAKSNPDAGDEPAGAAVVDLPADSWRLRRPDAGASPSDQSSNVPVGQAPLGSVASPPSPAARATPTSSVPVLLSSAPRNRGRQATAQEQWHRVNSTESPERSPRSTAPPKRSLEMLIGMSWMAWAGAASVVLAAGFFVKLAYDQGWFGLLTPTGKCILSAAFGGLLLVGGEVARRRVGRAAAASLFGAGIATLYLTAYATFRWFHLLSETGAFWLLLAVALLGFALTIHARMITTGVLATLGGYLTPILLSNASSFDGALLLYMSMLLVVTLSLSAWRERPFRVLRYVALCCHAVVGWLWVLDSGADEWALGLVFLGSWWLLVNGEALLAAVRGQSPRGNAIVSLFTTAWVTAVGYWLLGEVPESGRDWMGLFAVTLAALAAIPAAVFGPGVKVLSHLPKRAVEKFTVTLWAQTGVLLAAAIGFQCDDFGQTIGWLVLGYACIEVGRKLPSRGVDVFGLVVGALALARVAFIDSDNAALDGVFWKFYDIRITHWGLLALGAVATIYASALRFRVYGVALWAKLPVVLAGLGTLGWVVVCFMQTRGLAQTGSLLTAAFVLLASYHVGRRLRCFMYGSILLWLSVGKWIMVDAGAGRSLGSWPSPTLLPVFNALFGLALAITAAFAAIAWIHHRRAQAALEIAAPYSPLRRQFPIICAAVFLLLALGHETSRAISRYEAVVESVWSPTVLRALWWALLWAVGGVAMTFAARRWRWTYVGRVACVMTLAATGLWLCWGTIAPRVDEGVTQTTIVLNIQFLTGVLLAVCVAVAAWITPRPDDNSSLGEFRLRITPPLAFVIVVAIATWLGTLEIDRFFAPRIEHHPNAELYRLLWWTLLWAGGGLTLVLGGIRRRWTEIHHFGWTILALATLNWLVFGTLEPRVAGGIAITQVVFNVQFLVGLLVAAVVAAALRLVRSKAGSSFLDKQAVGSASAIAGASLIAIGLWLGSLELDRFFAPEAGRVAHAAMARQTALSIYWGVYAIGLVALGFARRVAWTRYVGLGLLTATLGKVLLVDMSDVASAYRILSFLGVGLLLIVTSLAYAKVSRRLAADEAEPRTM